MIVVLVTVCCFGEAGYFDAYRDLAGRFAWPIILVVIAYLLTAPIFVPVIIWIALGLGLSVEWMVRTWRRALRVPQDRTLRLEPVRVPQDRGADVRGRVVELEGRSLRSPLSGSPCVAFRLRGFASGEEVDDGDAATFELVTESGDRVRVEAPPAFVNVAAGAHGEPDDTGVRELSEFLAQRGIDASRGLLDLAEGCVVEGDLVEVRGAVFEEPDASSAGASFRAAPLVRVVRETSEQPLVIRKL